MATTTFVKSNRLQQLPPYLFAEIDRKKRQAIAEGRDVINLGVGDPDQPTPSVIIDALAEHARNPKFHQYALDQGDPQFRASIAAFLKRRYDMDLDPASEILPTIGSKEGIAHLPLAVLNPGEVSLVPDPGYPVYRTASQFAGGEVISMPLQAENGWIPDLDAIAPETYAKTRLMFLNYPNNPTAAMATRSLFEKAVELAQTYDFVVAHDAAYNEIYYDQPPISLLQIPGAREVAIEFHSLSKTFNMTGWRVGYAIGSPEIVAALGQVKANVDSGIFTAIQYASKEAIDQYEQIVPPIRQLYRQRRDAVIAELSALGWNVPTPQAAFYVWIPCPEGISSAEFSGRLLDQADLVATPGVGFGSMGEGYFRLTLTVDTPRLIEAVGRFAKVHV